MPLLCSVSDIKYTVVILNEDDYDEIINSAENNDNFDGISGFIHHGGFWSNGVRAADGHWSDEIICANPDAYMMVIEGSPESIDGILERYIAMEQDWYHQHDLYDIWQTPVGYVAVC